MKFWLDGKKGDSFTYDKIFWGGGKGSSGSSLSSTKSQKIKFNIIISQWYDTNYEMAMVYKAQKLNLGKCIC